MCLHLCPPASWGFPGVGWGGGPPCIPAAEATSILSVAPSGLWAEWRLRLWCVPFAGWCHAGSAGVGGQGRARAVVGTGPTPGLGINIPAAGGCLLGPGPGAATARQGPVAGAIRPQLRHLLWPDRRGRGSGPSFWAPRGHSEPILDSSARLPSLRDRDPGGGGWEAPGRWIGKKGGEGAGAGRVIPPQERDRDKLRLGMAGERAEAQGGERKG